MLKKTFFLFLIGFITIFVSQERVSAIIWSNLVKTRVGQISLATVGVGIVGFGVDCALETKKRLSRYPRKTKWQAFKTALKSGGELRIPSILTILVGSVFGFKNLMKKVKNDNGNLSGQSTADIGSETEGPEAGASQEISSEEQNSSGSNEDSIENKPLDKLNNVGDLDAATRKKLFENVNTNDGDRKKYKFSCQMCLEEHRCVEHMKICDQCWMPCCSGCAVHWGETSVSGETCPNCRGKNINTVHSTGDHYSRQIDDSGDMDGGVVKKPAFPEHVLSDDDVRAWSKEILQKLYEISARRRIVWVSKELLEVMLPVDSKTDINSRCNKFKGNQPGEKSYYAIMVALAKSSQKTQDSNVGKHGWLESLHVACPVTGNVLFHYNQAMGNYRKIRWGKENLVKFDSCRAAIERVIKKGPSQNLNF